MKIRLDIESLRAVRAVAHSGSVSDAAELLYLTQSAVSHKIKRLEQRLGRPLFRRVGGGLTITEDGGNLLAYAERLVELHDEAVAVLGRADLSGQIRMGLTDTVTGLGVSRILARFSAVYPDVALVSRVAHSLTLAQWLRDGEVDLALMQLFDSAPEPGDRVLWRDEVVWASSPRLHLADPHRLPFIAFDEHCFYREWAIHALRDTDFELVVVHDCLGVEGVADAVRSGLGVTLIDRRNLREGLAECALPLPRPPGVVNVVRAASHEPSMTVTALLDAIEEEIGQQPRNR